MKVKQIELIGFKSFAEKTILSLHNGITCIVGPNGCGKSNIVDAFRWVLGEQSAKSLRGEKMEEVIFQGSTTKKQRSMAEVTLVVSQNKKTQDHSDNNNGYEDSSDEISITRRLYRSGESEYLINKRPCRLKDIKDLFLDTGLDVKSYSILDQGKIADIINTKPIERRFLIEEIAGIMKYKVRKAEALSKLESSKNNLQRINDILHEVKRQLNSLDRQVRKAEKYKKLIAELKDVELRIAKRAHDQIKRSLESLSSEIKKIREEEASESSGLSDLENAIETRQIVLLEKEKQLSNIEEKLYEKEKYLSELEKKIVVLKTDIENKKREIIRLEQEKEQTKNSINSLITKSLELDELENSLSSLMEEYSNQLNEQKAQISIIEDKIIDKEQEIENKRKDIFKISEIISDKKNELHRLKSIQENLKYKKSIAIRDIDSIKSAINKMHNNIKETEGAIKAKEEDLVGLKKEKEDLIKTTDLLKKEIEDKKILQNQIRQDLASYTSRLNSLKELIIDRSIHDFESTNNYKILSDILNVQMNYEMALEAVLSDKVNALIIEDKDTLIKTIETIKEKRIERTTILYKNNRTNQGDEIKPSLDVKHKNILGSALDFLTLDDKELKFFTDNLLQNVYIVKDIEAAFEILESESLNNIEFSLVTLDGEFIKKDGWIFVGSGRDILKRKREIKELQSLIDINQRKIYEIETTMNSDYKDLKAKEDELRTKEKFIIEIEKQLTLLHHSLKDLTDKVERNERKISLLNSELTILDQESIGIETQIGIKTQEIRELSEKKESLNEYLKTMQDSISEIKEKYENMRSTMTELKVLIERNKEKLEATKKEKESIRNRAEELRKKIQKISTDISNSGEKIYEFSTEKERLEDKVKMIVIDIDNLQYERNRLKDEIITERQEINSKGNLIRNIRAQIDELHTKRTELNSLFVENKLKMENIEKALSQKYGINITTTNISWEEFDETEDEKRLDELNSKIRDLGPINLSMIEEYEELKNRYEFLTKQQQDLTKSIVELEEAINRIDSTTKRRLKDAYILLKEKFREIFVSLFGGGKADIILIDEENILESGIDIVAQPPGKKLQNINLLSGGEKALTALALLFASFLIKPSPLCILDEADAPLDESNTLRFANMIKELSKETQFIIITHNKTTMEVADYIYGITMEEPGSSKALSLQFVDINL
jgi:chromosome segregation protein